MARLIWTEPALLDLDEIAEYIALDDPFSASRYVQRVFDRVERLEVYPKSGKRRPELRCAECESGGRGQTGFVSAIENGDVALPRPCSPSWLGHRVPRQNTRVRRACWVAMSFVMALRKAR